MSTKKQSTVLEHIRNYKEKEGIYPTLNQISESMGLRSPSTIHQHISELVKDGMLIKSGDHSGFELPEQRESMNNLVPIVGYITAGKPIEAIEDTIPPSIRIDNIPKKGEFYALKVRGDSMIDDGIFDSDIVVIKKQVEAFDGQTVVAIIDNNKATLKKLYKEKKGFRLQPANQSILPIFRDEVEVRGIVWEIRRSNSTLIAREASKTQNFRTLDLFAGIGGIRIGFENAGFKTVFANDFDKACKFTYDLNFHDAKLVVEDITKIHSGDLPDFDFLLGGFPCQAFSIAGYRHGFKDLKGRGNLFLDIARILEARKPDGFLLENVKNLKTHDGGNTFKVIKATLKELGYDTKEKVLNSMEYGNVPQNRERIYIVGFKDKNKIEAFEFPEPVKLTKNIKDILEKNVDNKYYYNGKPLYERLNNEINEEGQVYQWRRQYVRKNKKGVCPTLTANMGMGGHNVPIIFDGKGIRKLTPRECFRLQGFEDGYKLPINIADSALYKQAGNSVTVSVIERIAKQMRQVL
jgi:DNA (cytosine-5)-methyltransferase 1